MKSTVSIAMCTYNGASFLRQQLNSLVNQSRRPDEIIICDDCSQDQSVEIAQNFANQHPDITIRVIQNPQNLGYVNNFEKAISLCTQDIIFLCDQDDLWQPEKIENMVSVFDAEPSVGLVLHDFCRIDEVNQLFPCAEDTYGPQNLIAAQLPQEIKNNSIDVFMQPYPRAWCGCMMAYRRSFNDVVLPIFPGKGHDDWILKILAPITETRFLASPLVHYRMHQQNTNRRDLEKRTLAYLWGRFVKKASLAIKGHTKSNFYRQTLNKLSQSGYPIRYPEILRCYRKYVRGPWKI
jgi:glycosyltransferase involved in cell wall biosynthesis